VALYPGGEWAGECEITGVGRRIVKGGRTLVRMLLKFVSGSAYEEGLREGEEGGVGNVNGMEDGKQPESAGVVLGIFV
jgi:hypothetical protein